MSADTPNGDESVPERFEPNSAAPSLMKAEHWARYRLAAQLAPGRRVLDAGCGTGYGTRLLADSGAAEVSGIDISGEALAAARARCETASFVEGDLSATRLPGGSFDLVTCFEVIEHLEEQEKVVAELSRLLAPDGILLVSSPNRDVYLAGNPHHVRELTPDELEDLLEARFERVGLLRQHPWIASAILDTGTQESNDPGAASQGSIVKVDGVEKGDETYTIAIASNGQIPELQPVAGLAEPTDLSDYVKAIKTLEQRLAEAKSALEAVGARRAAADREAEEAVNRQRAAELELARANAAIEGMTSSISWRATAPLRALRPK